MAGRQPIIAGNWKMHGAKASSAALLSALADNANATDKVEVGIFVPAVFLPLAEECLAGSKVRYGGQNMHPATHGAYTGEIAAGMLQEFGCQWVLVGHSERRQLFGESNEFIADKCFSACAQGLLPVLCVGETREEYETGQTEAVVGAQLDAILQREDALASLCNFIIAYEPVWAIGTGLTATPEQAQTVHAFIRAKLENLDKNLAQSVRILYGGSVKPDNVAGLVSQPDIDGGLVGGASLDAVQFNEIITQCTNCY